MNEKSSASGGQEDWRHRQAALADFGIEALRNPDLDAILRQSCVLIARGLRAPIAKVMEALPGGDELLIRAVVGLPPDLAVPGETRVPGGRGSSAGYALTVDRPVVSHTESETRFEISEIVRRSGVKVTVNVAIPTQNGPFGVLEVDSPEEREFSQDDIDFLRIYGSLLGAAVERQRATALVQILMREMQHRVKNDLQVVTAILTLETLQAGSPETRTRLESVASRVQALNLIHEHLLARERIGEVDLAGYLRELCRRRFEMHDLAPEDRITVDFRLAPVAVDHNRAVTIGIVVNEFLTNSLKHAFPTGEGHIGVTLEQPKPGLLRLVLADNGVGLLAPSPQGTRRMGLRLIDAMVEHIGGTMKWSNAGGTCLTLSLSEA